MNNYPSNNFPTVFFLVVLFIGMGLLIYHTYEVTNENGQLKETVGTLQASVETLNQENEKLNVTSTELADENINLKTTLEKTLAENASLNTEITVLRLVNATLTDENNKLKASYSNVQQLGNEESSNTNHEVLLSAFMPIGIETLMSAREVVLVMAIFLISYIIYVLLKNVSVKENHRLG